MSGTCGLQIQLHALNSAEGRSSRRPACASSHAGSQTGRTRTLDKRLCSCDNT